MLFSCVSDVQKSFDNIKLELQSQKETFNHRKTSLRRCGDDMMTVWLMDSWSIADSLKRKEDEVLDFRKRQKIIDLEVNSLYEKVIATQLDKVERMIHKLQKLAAKTSSLTGCPYGLTVGCYKEWIKTDSSLNSLQSEILDLLSRKARMRRELSDVNDQQTVSLFDGGKNSTLDSSFDNFENLRQRSYSIVMTEPLVDSEFSLFVHNRLTPGGCGFEARKMSSYIDACWDHKISHPQPTSSDDRICPYSPAAYQEFVCSLAEHIVNQFGHFHLSNDQQTCFDHVFISIENILYPQIEDCLLFWCQCNTDNENLDWKLKNIGSLSQDFFGITLSFQDGCPVPFLEAIVKLKSLSLASTPTMKLKKLLASAQLVMEFIHDICESTNETGGADQFMDIWVYVVAKARLESLEKVVYLLRHYCNPTQKNGEMAYFLASMELATEFLKGFVIPDL